MTGWDLDLFWHINRIWTHPVLDWLMPVLSAIELWMPLLGIALIGIAWRGGAQARWLLVAITLAIVLSDAIVGNTLKKTFDRVRPRDQMSGVMIRDVAKVKPQILALFQAPVIKTSVVKKVPLEGNSLPSNHTMNLFAVATVIALFFRRWGLPLYALAAAVAYSRVYVGAHWPSDIVPSVALGLINGWLAVAAVSSWRRPAPRQPGTPARPLAPH